MVKNHDHTSNHNSESKSSPEEVNFNLLQKVAWENGIDLFGVAEVGEERKNFCLLPESLILKLPWAVVMAARVSPTVLATLKEGPNHLYFHHYRQLNFLLDRVALLIAAKIEETGYLALPVAASQIIDWERQRGHVSHRQLAQKAGLGWQGRNNLLVTPQQGAQVRLVSILTNFPLKPGRPLALDCGTCRRCIAVCPAGAIKEEVAAFDSLACYQKLKEFSRQKGVGQEICGLCVKACAR